MDARFYIIEKKESAKLDFVKSVMCVAVLFLHSYSSKCAEADSTIASGFSWFTNYFSNIICDCAVPVFIILSAIFLYSRNFNCMQNIKKKFRTLLVPYFLINALWIIANILKAQVKSTESPFLSYGVIDWIDAFCGIRGDFKPALSALWYIRDLFILNVFAIPIKKLVDKFPRIILLCTFAIWLSGIKCGFVHSYAIAFFILGYYLVKYNIHIDKITMISMGGGNKLCLDFLICVVLSLLTALLPQLIVFHRAFILFEILFVFTVACRFNCNKNFIGVVAPATFFIYLTHRFVYMAIDFFFNDTLLSYMITYFLKPFLAFTLCLLAYYFMKKFLPRTLSLLTGGRSSLM